jgi:hypothetical protein
MKVLNKLICALTGHHYVVQRVFSPTSRKIGCMRCGKEWEMNDSVRAFVSWDGELEQLHRGIRPEWKKETVQYSNGEMFLPESNDEVIFLRSWAGAKATNKDEGSKPVPEDAAYAHAEEELVQILKPLIGKTVSVETREEAVALIAAFASEKYHEIRYNINNRENEMKKKPILAQKYNKLCNELVEVCLEIAAEINRGNTELALLMLGRDKAEQVGKRVPGPGGTEVMQAVVTFAGARFELEEAF